MKIFLDTEFTGLHQKTTLISIGLVSEDGREFYAEFTDYDKSQVNEWIRENVINKLMLGDRETYTSDFIKGGSTSAKGDKFYIKNALRLWLSSFDKEIGDEDESIEIWSDCLAYDWVLFCELFRGAVNIPKNIYYIPFDLSTLLKIKGVDPDINRHKFGEVVNDVDRQHNSISDAVDIKACYNKLMSSDFHL